MRPLQSERLREMTAKKRFKSCHTKEVHTRRIRGWCGGRGKEGGGKYCDSVVVCDRTMGRVVEGRSVGEVGEVQGRSALVRVKTNVGTESSEGVSAMFRRR